MEEEEEGWSTEAGSGVRREFSSAKSVAGPVQRQVPATLGIGWLVSRASWSMSGRTLASSPCPARLVKTEEMMVKEMAVIAWGGPPTNFQVSVGYHVFWMG